MNPYTVFIIDDEQTIRSGITMALEGRYEVESFGTAKDAISAMKTRLPDLVLLDIGLPGMNGIEALGIIKGMSSDCLVIMITAYEDAPTVIAAMKQGAYDYVIKPIVLESLEASIERALETIRLRKEVQSLQQTYLSENLPCFVTESHALQDLMGFIEKIAKSPDTPVLIVGETGTGKELVAGAIHYRSPNFTGAFVTLNCAAIPQHLLESELFGYEKGAFSGAATSGKKGLIEEARGGTLFLDEVGDLSVDAQAKLLRFLESGEFYRIGGTRPITVKTRVISATNKDIASMIEAKTFRKDLYFRLGVVKVNLPSLNQRPEDVAALAGYFLSEFNRKFHKRFTAISPQALEALRKHQFTGNVRELKNIMERAVLIGDGDVIHEKDLLLEGRPISAGVPLELPVLTGEGMDLQALQDALERHYIQTALNLTGGNEARAARLLNMKHHTLRYRRKRLEERT